jgi:hypothetical protein
MHDANLYAIRAIDAAHFATILDGLVFELEYFEARCRYWGIPFDPAAARNRSLWSLECRLILDKLTAIKYRFFWDSSPQPFFRKLYQTLHACIDTRTPISNRIIHAVWLISVAFTPKPIASRLIALRFVHSGRPVWFEGALATLTNSPAYGGYLPKGSTVRHNIAAADGSRARAADVLQNDKSRMN